ncbi:MAG TPA: EAL domain-containing protein [Thiotrichales bacterium]|nr:EAL domain-containing protein [Thiotrichales bacterium]
MDDQAIRVLLVEDSPVETEIVLDILGTAGQFRVVTTASLQEALEALNRRTTDIVVLDLNLPDASGLEGFRRIQSAHPGVPIVILTNQHDEAMATEAVRLGAQDYLLKQEIDRPTLTRAIRYAIGRHEAEQRLRDSEERYALAVSGANDGIWDWDLHTGQVYFSQRWREIMDLHEEPPRLEAWFERVFCADRHAFQAELDRHINGESENLEFEHRIRRRDGEVRWVLLRGAAIRDSAGIAYRMAGSLTDISHRKRIEAQLIHNAMHDALTGLPNRSLFLDRLDLRLRRFQRDPARRFAVLFFDLDRFKNINDGLGHAAGDKLLCLVGDRIAAFIRPGDTLARLSGDEFAILLDEVDTDQAALGIAARLQRLFEKPFTVENHEVFVEVSIGIAMSHPDYKAPEDILRDADLAMYRAKRSHHDRCKLFGSALHETVVRLHRMETNLRRAIERDEFELYYQPIVSTEDGRVTGVEALVRWQHPEEGLILPGAFTSLAEDTGMIVPLGWLVIEKACRQAYEWSRTFRDREPPTVSINVSGRMFRDPNMAVKLLDTMERYDLPRSTIQVEVTESAVMDHHKITLRQIEMLREAQVGLHIDDFGTGYSSLSNLAKFNYDTLKIDRSFVQGVDHDPEKAAIVKAIIYLGRMLRMRVIAEGVETGEQCRWLVENECPLIQGFWVSPPQDAEQITRFIREWPHMCAGFGERPLLKVGQRLN